MPFAVNVKLQNILDIVKTSIIIKLKLNQNINHGNGYIKKTDIYVSQDIQYVHCHRY